MNRTRKKKASSNSLVVRATNSSAAVYAGLYRAFYCYYGCCCCWYSATVCGALAFYYRTRWLFIGVFVLTSREYSYPGPEHTSESSGKKRLLFTGTSISITITRVVHRYRTHNDYVGINESSTFWRKMLYNETAFLVSGKQREKSVELFSWNRDGIR